MYKENINNIFNCSIVVIRNFPNKYNKAIYTDFLITGQNVQVRPGTLPQVVQFPTMQQTVPVQVPISTGNGQTIYQTVHVPLQAFATQMPGLVQPQMQIFPQIAQVKVFKMIV